ncbi:hypothetical protein AgCh_028173 [Apium graveolens]
MHNELVPYVKAWTRQKSIVEERKELVDKNEDFCDSVIVKLLIMVQDRALEEVVIRLLSSCFTIKAARHEGLTGVWVDCRFVVAKTPYDRPPPPPPENSSTNWLTGHVIPNTSTIIAKGVMKLFTFMTDTNSISENDDSEDEDDVARCDDDVPFKKDNTATEINNGEEPQLSVKSPKWVIENLLLQETFSREESDKLIEIIKSRVVDCSTMEEGQGAGLMKTPSRSYDTPDRCVHPPWASPSLRNSKSRTPSPMVIDLFKDEKLSSADGSSFPSAQKREHKKSQSSIVPDDSSDKVYVSKSLPEIELLDASVDLVAGSSTIHDSKVETVTANINVSNSGPPNGNGSASLKFSLSEGMDIEQLPKKPDNKPTTSISADEVCAFSSEASLEIPLVNDIISTADGSQDLKDPGRQVDMKNGMPVTRNLNEKLQEKLQERKSSRNQRRVKGK